MKTTIIETKDSKKLNYPLIAKYLELDMYVLFTDKKTGTVIVSGRSNNNVGYHSDTFISVDMYNIWEIVENITIKFEI